MRVFSATCAKCDAKFPFILLREFDLNSPWKFWSAGKCFGNLRQNAVQRRTERNGTSKIPRLPRRHSVSIELSKVLSKTMDCLATIIVLFAHPSGCQRRSPVSYPLNRRWKLIFQLFLEFSGEKLSRVTRALPFNSSSAQSGVLAAHFTLRRWHEPLYFILFMYVV